MVTVPAVVPDTPHLPANPVIAYLPDDFQKPYPFQPAVVVDVGRVVEQIAGMLHCHQSQFYEWLPYNAGYIDQVPKGDQARRAWLTERIRRRIRPLADRYRELVVQTYGPERGRQVQLIEAFEVSEFGAPLDAGARARLFPFLPAVASAASAFVRKDWVDIPEEE